MRRSLNCGSEHSRFIIGTILVALLTLWSATTGAQAGAGMVTIRSGRPLNMAAVVTMLSDMGNLNIIATEEVARKNVFVSAKDLPALDVLNMIAEASDFETIEKEGPTIVVMTSNEYARVRGRSLDVRVFTLSHIRADDAAKVIQPALSDVGQVLSSVATNQLVVMDHATVIPSVSQIVSGIDKDLFTEVIELNHVEARDVALLLKGIIKSPGELSVSDDENYVVIADTPRNIERAREAIAQIDVPSDLVTETFYLEYASCTEVGMLLEQMFRVEKMRRDDRDRYPTRLQQTQPVQPDTPPAPTSAQATEPGQPPQARSAESRFFPVGREGSAFVDTRNNSIIVTAEPGVMKRVREVINSMDTELQPFTYKFNHADLDQLDLETKLKDILTNKVETVHMDTANMSVTFFTIPSKARLVMDLLETWDVEPIQVMIEAQLFSVSNDTLERLGVDFEARNVRATGPDGEVLTSQEGRISLAPLVGAGDPISELIIGNLTTSDYMVLIRAIATDSSTKTISEPRITTLNHQEATFSDTRQEPYTVVTVEGDTQTVLEDIRFLNVGITLQVVPHVNDYKDVKLDVRLQLSHLVEIRNGIPVVDTTMAQAISMTKDGRPVLLGGLELVEFAHVSNRVPFISRIPILGLPFRSKDDDTTDRQLMLVLIPHIVRADEQLQMQSDIADMEEPLRESISKQLAK